MKKMPEFIVHVSVELADSMVEEKTTLHQQ